MSRDRRSLRPRPKPRVHLNFTQRKRRCSPSGLWRQEYRPSPLRPERYRKSLSHEQPCLGGPLRRLPSSKRETRSHHPKTQRPSHRKSNFDGVFHHSDSAGVTRDLLLSCKLTVHSQARHVQPPWCQSCTRPASGPPPGPGTHREALLAQGLALTRRPSWHRAWYSPGGPASPRAPAALSRLAAPAGLPGPGRQWDLLLPKGEQRETSILGECQHGTIPSRSHP